MHGSTHRRKQWGRPWQKTIFLIGKLNPGCSSRSLTQTYIDFLCTQVNVGQKQCENIFTLLPTTEFSEILKSGTIFIPGRLDKSFWVGAYLFQYLFTHLLQGSTQKWLILPIFRLIHSHIELCMLGLWIDLGSWLIIFPGGTHIFGQTGMCRSNGLLFYKKPLTRISPTGQIWPA